MNPLQYLVLPHRMGNLLNLLFLVLFFTLTITKTHLTQTVIIEQIYRNVYTT